MQNKTAVIIAFVVSGLPLLVYPFVLIANVMSFAGHRTGKESVLAIIFSNAFMLSTTLYPVVYVFSYILYRRSHNNLFIALPYIYLFLILIVSLIWSKVS